jgi:hypothetical protein
MMDMTGVINPMTKAQCEAWCVALESGEYAQATGQLKTAKGFCCLGVERELRPELSPGIHRASPGMLMPDLQPATKSSAVGDTYRLPYAVQEDLARMNDSGDKFPEIAAHIRKTICPKLPE